MNNKQRNCIEAGIIFFDELGSHTQIIEELEEMLDLDDYDERYIESLRPYGEPFYTMTEKSSAEFLGIDVTDEMEDEVECEWFGN